jgi:hypothetical protein
MTRPHHTKPLPLQTSLSQSDRFCSAETHISAPPASLYAEHPARGLGRVDDEIETVAVAVFAGLLDLLNEGGRQALFGLRAGRVVIVSLDGQMCL